MAKSFSAEAHYESKIKQGSIKNQSAVLRFNNSVFEPKQSKIEKGFRRICKDQFNYSCFSEINTLHCEYLRKIKETAGPKGFLENLFKAELTGAKIKIANRIGFVVEERKNTLVVIFEGNDLKIFAKKVFNFSVLFEGVEYFFYSENLKKGRPGK